jgi:hypothetical protein
MTAVQGYRQILLEDQKTLSVGFPGKVVKGKTETSKVMQIGKIGQKYSHYLLEKITTGKYKGFYVIKTHSGSDMVLDVIDKTYANKAYIVSHHLNYHETQIWKLVEDNESNISSPDGVWCMTRFDQITEVQLP